MRKAKKHLQERGQFVVKHIGGPEDIVPVDNFVFMETNDRPGVKDRYAGSKNSIKLETTSGCTYVTWKMKKSKSEEYDTTAEALRRMADILEGAVTYRKFGHAGRPQRTLNFLSLTPKEYRNSELEDTREICRLPNGRFGSFRDKISGLRYLTQFHGDSSVTKEDWARAHRLDP